MNAAIAWSLSRGGMSLAIGLADERRAACPSARRTACRAPRPWSGSSGRRARRRRSPRRRCPTPGRCGSPAREHATAASRIIRRLSRGARRRAVTRHGLPSPSRRLASEGSVAPDPAWRSRSRSATIERLGVGRLREHDPPRVDDHRAPAGARARSRARRSGWPRPRTPGPRSRAPAAGPPSGRAWWRA